jgi:DNA-binding LacI/PurR family transcriptional regulator
VTIVNHLPGIPHVHIDDFKAAYDSTCYISQAGYKRICFICTPLRKKGSFENKLNITSQELRVQGFKHFMEANPEFQYDILTQRNYHEQAALMAKKKGGKIAFLCSSDVHAIELLQAFEKDGVAVPGDAGIMGFDNLDILAYIKPRLTTTSTSIELVAQKAISTLLKIIQGEKVPSRTYVSHSICPGATL